ncbi:MAG: type I restriction endonuclease subunit R [Spiroplasma phoeniceum]
MENKYISESELEKKFINNLKIEGYEYIKLNNEEDIKTNFRNQIFNHNKNELNNKPLTDKEFEKLLFKIMGKSIFNSAKILRQKITIERDDFKKVDLELFNKDKWCDNIFQFTNQLTIKSIFQNRYDITILINGLPLIQIELKKPGINFKEALNQINRYKKESHKGLLKFIQFFIISNIIDTKYFSNNDGNILFENSFYWTDELNNRITNLFDFTKNFLNKCHVSKMIARYMIINESKKKLMIMRPYQIYAVEKLIKIASETNNAYVWHTTGSGKTLTSFKLSQILKYMPEKEKIFFLVDRKDLDFQTIEEFNKYEKDSVDYTESTYNLIKNIQDSTKKIILTTIQKMANACKNEKYKSIMAKFKNKKVIFIIDECHRSQFGKMYVSIKKIFEHAQYFGFTGTPRFEQNKSEDGRTTADIFHKCIHKYLLNNAIADGNVLGFNVDYMESIRNKKDTNDELIEDINNDELLIVDSRINSISKNIIETFSKKTYGKKYNAIFAVKNINMAIKYYKTFKNLKHNLKIASIFTFEANEDLNNKDFSFKIELEKIIKDYNINFDTNFNINRFNEYFIDLQKKVKNKEIDLLIVVDMFLTGFDSPITSALYLDKLLKYHKLIQAFSRTNRIINITKPFGNIVCYQTTKKTVDEAILLFSNSTTTDQILMKPFDYYELEFIKLVNKLKKDYNCAYDVGNDGDEVKIKEFIFLFKEIVKILLKLETFIEFDINQSKYNFSENKYNEFKSRYLSFSDEKIKKEKLSVLADVDFELELIYSNKINVHYILELLKKIDLNNIKRKEKQIKEIKKGLQESTDPVLKYKSELINSFIERVIPTLKNTADLEVLYEQFCDKKYEQQIIKISKKYNIDKLDINEIISEYRFTNQLPSNLIREKINQQYTEKIAINKNISKIKAKNEVKKELELNIINLINEFES